MIYQQPLPSPYPTLDDAELTSRIVAAKAKLGDSVVILTHHYQRPEIVALGDMRGDSLKLAQFAAAQEKSKYIVYCGVHFMAESADILKRGQQVVVLPDLGAGCDMADMADADDVELAWDELVSVLGHESIMPVTYINSTAALKAFVGKRAVSSAPVQTQRILCAGRSSSVRRFSFSRSTFRSQYLQTIGIHPGKYVALEAWRSAGRSSSRKNSRQSNFSLGRSLSRSCNVHLKADTCSARSRFSNQNHHSSRMSDGSGG